MFYWAFDFLRRKISSCSFFLSHWLTPLGDKLIFHCVFCVTSFVLPSIPMSEYMTPCSSLLLKVTRRDAYLGINQIQINSFMGFLRHEHSSFILCFSTYIRPPIMVLTSLNGVEIWKPLVVFALSQPTLVCFCDLAPCPKLHHSLDDLTNDHFYFISSWLLD